MSKPPMMATELIAKLAQLIREHGDQPIGLSVSSPDLDMSGDALSVSHEEVTCGCIFSIYGE